MAADSPFSDQRGLVNAHSVQLVSMQHLLPSQNVGVAVVQIEQAGREWVGMEKTEWMHETLWVMWHGCRT
jgi:hypothetical protein